VGHAGRGRPALTRKLSRAEARLAHELEQSLVVEWNADEDPSSVLVQSLPVSRQKRPNERPGAASKAVSESVLVKRLSITLLVGVFATVIFGVGKVVLELVQVPDRDSTGPIHDIWASSNLRSSDVMPKPDPSPTSERSQVIDPEKGLRDDPNEVVSSTAEKQGNDEGKAHRPSEGASVAEKTQDDVTEIPKDAPAFGFAPVVQEGAVVDIPEAPEGRSAEEEEARALGKGGPLLVKVEGHWFDVASSKVRSRKDYFTTIASAFAQEGFKSTHQHKVRIPPGVVAQNVTLVWGIHWENVFTAPGLALPRPHRNGLLGKHGRPSIPVPDSYNDAFLALGPHTTINMIPGIVFELCSKTGLVSAVNAAETTFGWKEMFLPTFIVNSDPDAFKLACKPGTAWALKPFNGAEGEGIRIVGCSEKELDALPDLVKHHRIVAQQYVLSPVLSSQGHKFDLRTWMLVTSIEPLRAFVVRDAHVRGAGEPFDPNPDLFRHKCMHLTNGMVQKRCRERHDSHVLGNTITSTSFWNQTFEMDSSVAKEEAWAHVQDAMVRSIIAATPAVTRNHIFRKVRARMFQLLAFDVILEQNTQASPKGITTRVLEVNADGYMKKGFQRIPGGPACTRAIPRLIFAHDALETHLDDAERICRASSKHHDCKKDVALHLAELQTYADTCWKLAFPAPQYAGILTGARDGYLQLWQEVSSVHTP